MMRSKHTPLHMFIKLWNDSTTAGEVAAVVGRPVETVRRRASNLRRQGHELKSMRNDVDVKALSALIQNPIPHEKTHEHFVLVWQRSLSIKEVMRHTGLSRDMVRQKAKTIRQAGVPLKRFNIFHNNFVAHVPAQRLDVDNLTPCHYKKNKP